MLFLKETKVMNCNAGAIDIPGEIVGNYVTKSIIFDEEILILGPMRLTLTRSCSLRGAVFV